MKVTRQQADWDDLATVNPLWVSWSDEARSEREWDPDEFFALGRQHADRVIAYLERRAPGAARGRALDFGCGVGRVTAGLARHFDEVVGVDISTRMIALARDHHRDNPRCRFEVNDRTDLSLLSDDSFDLVYSFEVLQHVPTVPTIASYVADFVRVLRPGGYLLFQLPGRLSLTHRLKVRRHAYRLLRALGVPPHTLYHRLRVQPTKLLAVGTKRVLSWLPPEAEVIEVENENAYETRYLVRKRVAGTG